MPKVSVLIKDFLLEDLSAPQKEEVLNYLNSEGLLLSGTSVQDALGLKLNIADIIDDLVTGGSNKTLSADQGVALKRMIDTLAGAKDLEPMNTARAYEVGEAFYWTDGKNYRATVASAIGVTPTTTPANFKAFDDGLQPMLTEGAFVDGDKTKLDNQSGTNTGDQDLSSYATRTGAENLANKTLTNPTIDNYTEGDVAIGSSGVAQTLSLTSGTFQTVTLTADCTFTMPTATIGKSFTLKILTGAGAFAPAFTGVKWEYDVAPVFDDTAGNYYFVTFIADGALWSGSASGVYTV